MPPPVLGRAAIALSNKCIDFIAIIGGVTVDVTKTPSPLSHVRHSAITYVSRIKSCNDLQNPHLIQSAKFWELH